MEPVGVLAKRGMMMGGGKGPVKGIRMKGFCMNTAWINGSVCLHLESGVKKEGNHRRHGRGRCAANIHCAYKDLWTRLDAIWRG